jgi:hypothetical protein
MPACGFLLAGLQTQAPLGGQARMGGLDDGPGQRPGAAQRITRLA